MIEASFSGPNLGSSRCRHGSFVFDRDGALGTTFSAFWIMSINSWMQGFGLCEETGPSSKRVRPRSLQFGRWSRFPTFARFPTERCFLRCRDRRVVRVVAEAITRRGARSCCAWCLSRRCADADPASSYGHLVRMGMSTRINLQDGRRSRRRNDEKPGRMLFAGPDGGTGATCSRLRPPPSASLIDARQSHAAETGLEQAIPRENRPQVHPVF